MAANVHIRIPHEYDGVRFAVLVHQNLGFDQISNGNHIVMKHPNRPGHISIPRH
jgi:hypothetical protein